MVLPNAALVSARYLVKFGNRRSTRHLALAEFAGLVAKSFAGDQCRPLAGNNMVRPAKSFRVDVQPVGRRSVR